MEVTRGDNLSFIIKTLAEDCQVSFSGGEEEVSSWTVDDKKTIMRGLENIRNPIPASKEFLEAEARELAFQLEEKGGVVSINDLGDGPIVVWQGDITRLAVDAIVNAANSQLLGCWKPMHKCIDNVIHTSAGVRLRIECAEVMDKLAESGCEEEETGSAKITAAYNLPCKHVLHTVGPIIEEGAEPTEEEELQLASCYLSCLQCAEEHHLESVAFCCISTGVFCFPNRRAAEIAVATVQDFMKTKASSVKKVIFNTFKDIDDALYRKLLSPKKSDSTESTDTTTVNADEEMESQ